VPQNTRRIYKRNYKYKWLLIRSANSRGYG